MVNGNCAVVSCTNSRYKIKVWEKKICEEHLDQLHKDCPCPRPFRLYTFPSVLLNSDKRAEWTRLMKRTTKRNTAWTPGSSDMVCSKHFINGQPTLANPNPTIELGYEKPAKKARRKLIRQELAVPEPDMEASLHDQTASVAEPDQSCSSFSQNPCMDCLDKSLSMESMAKEVTSLKKEKTDLQATLDMLCCDMKKLQLQKKIKKPLSVTTIKSDAKMRFYTGIQTIAIFNVIFSLLKPYLPKLVYWRGSKVTLSKKTRNTPIRSQTHKLCGKDKLLLVLMRLRLGLLNQDLADRFQISEASCSNIFSTWIRFLSKILGDALIVWLPKESIVSNLPALFKAGHKKTRCIIDCSEVYIERPKSLSVQAATWSDYKKHNTFKFLIGIAPSGFITFLSDSYGGRTSDQYICQNSGFYRLLEYGDEIMADRGFQIKEDLLHHYCTLSIPPGARVKSQMTAKECKKTKEVANLRIHVERAINRLKYFRILKNTFPITMLPFADDIIRTCAAICNIQPPLIKE